MNTPDPRRQQLRKLFTELITAYGEKDFATFARYVRSDALFDWPYLPLKTFPTQVRGREAFIDLSKAGMAECDGYGHVVDQFYDMLDPDMLIVEYHSEVVLPNSGRRYANKYLGILRFDGQEVVYWREYVNPLPIIEAYGLDFANDAVAP